MADLGSNELFRRRSRRHSEEMFQAEATRIAEILLRRWREDFADLGACYGQQMRSMIVSEFARLAERAADGDGDAA